jgi:hypothetical protein
MYHRRRQQIRALRCLCNQAATRYADLPLTRLCSGQPFVHFRFADAAATLSASFRRLVRSDIVHFVLPPAKMRAKLTIVAFVLITLLCGSVCSATCALGACPTDTQNASTHDCDHSASNPAHQSTPQNPDCPKHHHPTFDALKTDALAQSQLASTNRATAAQLLAVNADNEGSAVSSRASFSDLAPPPDFSSPLDQQVSVLRI